MPTASDSIRRARPLLGTIVEIELTADAGAKAEAAIDAAFAAVAEVHRLMSFHECDSDVSRINQAGVRPTRVHAWTFEVLEAAVELQRRSRGAFNVAIAPALQAVGLLPAPGSQALIAPGQCVADAIELLPEREVRLSSPDVTIDLGGIAKGFAVDRALEVLHAFDMPGGLVNAGGDLRVFGQSPHTIHLRDPRDPLRPIARLDLVDEALASTALRFDLVDGVLSQSSAIIDPATGKTISAIVGATVRAGSCMMADALTKIVMICGTDAGGLLEHYGASALLISANGDIEITSDWPEAVHLAA